MYNAGIYRVPFISLVEMTKRSVQRGIRTRWRNIQNQKHSLPHSKVAFFPHLSLYIAWR